MVLLLVSPAMVIVAVMVRQSSSGPRIFRQQRIGTDGELFDALKFRNMADGNHEQVLSHPDVRRLYEQRSCRPGRKGVGDPRSELCIEMLP